MENRDSKLLYLLVYFKDSFLYASDEFAGSTRQLNFIKESMKPTYFTEDKETPNDELFLGVQISPEFYNDKMKYYLSKHRTRFA